MFQIDLNAEGNLQLILPDARRLEIPVTVGGLEYIKKVLADHHRGLRNQCGYIGTLPTQHAVDKHFADEFLAKKREKAAEEKAQATRDKFGFDLDQLRISL
jgi:hypothetical protein